MIISFYEGTLTHNATWQLNSAVVKFVQFPTEVSLNTHPCDQLNIPRRPGGVFPFNKPEGSHDVGLCQDLQVLTEGAAGNFSNGTICNFFCHGRDKREKRDEKEERVRRLGMHFKRESLAGLNFPCLSRVVDFFFFLPLCTDLCQTVLTQDRARGTLREYTSPRFAFQPTFSSEDSLFPLTKDKRAF